MGMFDYVEYQDTCKNCGATLIEFQSKDGECLCLTLQPKCVENFYSLCSKCETFNEYKVKIVIEREDKMNKYLINNYNDREKVITALANAGYKVWVEERQDDTYNTIYYVCVENRKEK